LVWFQLTTVFGVVPAS